MIPAATRQAAHQLHINTGHRGRLRLARAVLIAGAPPAAIEAAKQRRCSVCTERIPPNSRLPASLPPPREVGQQLHVDLVILKDSLHVSVVYRWYIAMFLATMLWLYPNLSGVVTPWSPLSQAEDQSDKVGLMNHG